MLSRQAIAMGILGFKGFYKLALNFAITVQRYRSYIKEVGA
jgi:hypothetical protein